MSTRDTQRAEFEKWVRTKFAKISLRRWPDDDEDGLGGNYVDICVLDCWLSWQAAYLAGQESMRERAAKVCEDYAGYIEDHVDFHDQYLAVSHRAKEIRGLRLDGGP